MNLWLKNLLVPAIASSVRKESQTVNIISPLVSSRPVNNNSLRATHFFWTCSTGRLFQPLCFTRALVAVIINLNHASPAVCPFPPLLYLIFTMQPRKRSQLLPSKSDFIIVCGFMMCLTSGTEWRVSKPWRKTRLCVNSRRSAACWKLTVLPVNSQERCIIFLQRRVPPLLPAVSSDCLNKIPRSESELSSLAPERRDCVHPCSLVNTNVYKWAGLCRSASNEHILEGEIEAGQELFQNSH